MDFKQLQYFVAVAERLNFSRAAESLYLSQPALSQRIAELEQELGTVLLLRSRRGVELTAAGRSFFDDARAILAQMEALPRQTALAARAEREVTRLRIGLTGDAIKMDWFRRAVARAVWGCKRRSEHLLIELQETDYTELPAPLNDGTLDLCLCFNHRPPAASPGIQSEVLVSDRLALMLAAEHPFHRPGATGRDILSGKVDILLLDTNPSMQMQMSSVFAEMGVSPTLRYLSNEAMTLLQAYAGEGALLYPRRMIAALERSDAAAGSMRVYDIDAVSAGVYFFAVWRSGCGPAVAEFLEQLRSQL